MQAVSFVRVKDQEEKISESVFVGMQVDVYDNGIKKWLPAIIGILGTIKLYLLTANFKLIYSEIYYGVSYEIYFEIKENIAQSGKDKKVTVSKEGYSKEFNQIV